LVEHSNSIILHWACDGRILFLNEFGQRFFGYTEAEICGRHVIGTIVPESENGGRDLHALMDEICSNPAAFEQNINQNMRRNGERVWIAWTNKVVMDPKGQVAEILSIGLDITERKRMEEELRATQANLEQRVMERTPELAVARDRAEAADRTKSAFLATMSHELRTPLNSIIGFTGLLLQGLAGPLNAEQAKQLRMVKESGQHLLALINDVLDISKIEAGQIEIINAPFELPVSIQKVVETVRPLAEKKHLRLVVQIVPDMTRIVSDRRRVDQILLNLLSNAIKFTKRGKSP
jgi:PAS domain S-box-containing protein